MNFGPKTSYSISDAASPKKFQDQNDFDANMIFNKLTPKKEYIPISRRLSMSQFYFLTIAQIGKNKFWPKMSFNQFGHK